MQTKIIQHETLFHESPVVIMDCQLAVVNSNENGALIQLRIGTDPKSCVMAEYSLDRAAALMLGTALIEGV